MKKKKQGCSTSVIEEEGCHGLRAHFSNLFRISGLFGRDSKDFRSKFFEVKRQKQGY